MKARITRRTKLGWGWTSACENAIDATGNSYLRVCEVTRPDYTGTLATLYRKIENDRTFQITQSGGTYYSTAWFVRIDGQWKKIKPSETFMLDTITWKDYTKEYIFDYVDIEVLP